MTRDEVIKLVEDNGLTLHGDIEHFAELVAQHEREACAKLCEEMRTYVGRNNVVAQSSAQDCATAIRARGAKND